MPCNSVQLGHFAWKEPKVDRLGFRIRHVNKRHFRCVSGQLLDIHVGLFFFLFLKGSLRIPNCAAHSLQGQGLYLYNMIPRNLFVTAQTLLNWCPALDPVRVKINGGKAFLSWYDYDCNPIFIQKHNVQVP